MAEEKEWQEGMSTYENIIFPCFGGLSNTGITSTGITSALAYLGAVKELGSLVLPALLPHRNSHARTDKRSGKCLK